MTPCAFVALMWRLWNIFSCPLAQSWIAWIQSLLFRASPLAPTMEARHLLFGFSADEFRCIHPVFAYPLNVCKYFIWVQRNDLWLLSLPALSRLTFELNGKCNVNVICVPFKGTSRQIVQTKINADVVAKRAISPGIAKMHKMHGIGLLTMVRIT